MKLPNFKKLHQSDKSYLKPMPGSHVEPVSGELMHVGSFNVKRPHFTQKIYSASAFVLFAAVLLTLELTNTTHLFHRSSTLITGGNQTSTGSLTSSQTSGANDSKTSGTNNTGKQAAGTTTNTSGQTTTNNPNQPAAISALATVQADLRAALAATVWPNIQPAFTTQATADDKGNRGCTSDKINPIAQCTWGDASAPHTFYLVGDSTSAAYLPAFNTFIDQESGWKMVVRSDSGCPFSTDPASEGHGLDPHAGSPECAAHNESVVSEIESVKPDMVVYTSVSGAIANIPGKQAELERIHPYVGKIVVLPTSPPIQDPTVCDVAGSKPSACNTPIPAAFHLWIQNFSNIAKDVNGTFIDTTQLFCADGQCPVFVKTIPKTDDGLHPTVQYSQYLGPALHELFQQNKLLP